MAGLLLARRASFCLQKFTKSRDAARPDRPVRRGTERCVSEPFSARRASQRPKVGGDGVARTPQEHRKAARAAGRARKRSNRPRDRGERRRAARQGAGPGAGPRHHSTKGGGRRGSSPADHTNTKGEGDRRLQGGARVGASLVKGHGAPPKAEDPQVRW